MTRRTIQPLQQPGFTREQGPIGEWLGWVEPVSLVAGVAIGAFGWSYAIPALGAFIGTAGAVPFAVSTLVAAGALGLALTNPAPIRTARAPFRTPTDSTGAGNLPSPGIWVRDVAYGGPPLDDEAVSLLAGTLGRQLSYANHPSMYLETDVLLLVGPGQARPGLLDDLALALTSDLRMPSGRDVALSGRRFRPRKDGGQVDLFKERLAAEHPDLPSLRAGMGELHSFPVTRLLGALAKARTRAVVPAADFAWLAGLDGAAWLAACASGTDGAHPEALGILAHYRAEVAAGHGIDRHAVASATAALAALDPDPPETSANASDGTRDWRDSDIAADLDFEDHR